MINNMTKKNYAGFTAVLLCAAQASLVHAETDAALLNLDFKTVMMRFYSKQIRQVNISELDKNKQQYTGSLPDNQGRHQVLLFDAAQKFKNLKGEERYIVTVTHTVIDEDRKEIAYCGACYQLTDVFLFKKSSDGKFQLTTRSPENQGWYAPAYERQMYYPVQIVKNMRKLGTAQQGILQEMTESSHGESHSQLYVMPITDDQPLKQSNALNLGNDNEDSGEDETYHKTAKYKLLNSGSDKSEHDGLYDIEIQYSGTELKEHGGKQKAVPVNAVHRYQYNAKKQQYLLKK